MLATDLAAVEALAARLHPSFPEDDAVFAERLRLYAEGCLVLAQGPDIAGYVVSHPWLALQPPPLNSLLGNLPASPSTFYIHDLALEHQARASGAAARIVEALGRQARRMAAPTMSLIAVNGSEGFWRRRGFQVVEQPVLASKLRSYGRDALFMARDLTAMP